MVYFWFIGRRDNRSCRVLQHPVRGIPRVAARGPCPMLFFAPGAWEGLGQKTTKNARVRKHTPGRTLFYRYTQAMGTKPHVRPPFKGAENVVYSKSRWNCWVNSPAVGCYSTSWGGEVCRPPRSINGLFFVLFIIGQKGKNVNRQGQNGPGAT